MLTHIEEKVLSTVRSADDHVASAFVWFPLYLWRSVDGAGQFSIGASGEIKSMAYH